MTDSTPVKFSTEIATQVCAYIASGYSLRKVQQQEGMPSVSGIMKWLYEGEAYKVNGQPEHPKALFVEQYTRAKEAQADLLAEEILIIADESHYDSFVDEDGKRVVNMEHIQRDRLRVDSRKWLAGKLRPKKYGDRTIHAGDPENPVAVTGLGELLANQDGNTKTVK